MKLSILRGATIAFVIILFGINNSFAQQGVGIGANSNPPAEMLDVDGAIKIGTTTNTNTGTIRWNGTNFQGYDGTQWVNFGGGADDGDWTFNGNNLNYNILGTGGAEIIIGADGVSHANTSLRVGNAVMLRSNGNSYFTGGNMGLGTLTPAYDLDIYKTEVNVNQRIYANNASGIGALSVGANGGGVINLVANSSASTHLGVPAGNSGIVANWGDMVFATGTGNSGTERMRIISGGNGLKSYLP